MDDVVTGVHSPTTVGSSPLAMPQPLHPDEDPPSGDAADGEGRLDADQTETVSLDAVELVNRHQRSVWRYLRMLGCDDATADDLTQETFLRVLRRSDFVQHNDSATAGYLRRTAYNLLVSRHRKLGRVQTIAEPELLDETWDRWAWKDLTGDAAV